jgi:hypothetical protein
VYFISDRTVARKAGTQTTYAIKRTQAPGGLRAERGLFPQGPGGRSPQQPQLPGCMSARSQRWLGPPLGGDFPAAAGGARNRTRAAAAAASLGLVEKAEPVFMFTTPVALALSTLFRARRQPWRGSCPAPIAHVVLTVGSCARLAHLTGARPAGRSGGCTAPAPARGVAGCEARVYPCAPGVVVPEVRRHDRARGTKEFWILSSTIIRLILVAPAARCSGISTDPRRPFSGRLGSLFFSALEGPRTSKPGEFVSRLCMMCMR